MTRPHGPFMPCTMSAEYNMLSLSMICLAYSLQAVSGLVKILYDAPIIRVKYIQQCQNELPAARPRVASFLDAIATFSWSKDDVTDLWRGVPAAGLRVIASSVGSRVIYPYVVKPVVGSEVRSGSVVKVAVSSFLTGCATGFSCMVLAFPFDVVRARMAVDIVYATDAHRYASSLDCATELIHDTSSMAILLQSLAVGVVGAGVYRAIMRGVEAFCEPRVKKGSFAAKFIIRIGSVYVAGLQCLYQVIPDTLLYSINICLFAQHLLYPS